nr:reverse transcriptase domain-containing protein [Tanacetum cinerariifolium]
MRTRSSSNLIVESFMILKRCNRRRSKQIVKPELRTIVETPVATMADTRTMSELLQAPIEGYGDAIVIPAILAENFEFEVGLLSLVTSKLHQIDTLYNALIQSDQDSLNAAAGGNLLNRTPLDALTIIENKSKRGDVKAITTQSGVAYEGPSISTTSSSLLKEVKREPEVTKDKVQTKSSKSTAHVQPLVVQVPILEPDVAPKPNPKPSIPYPTRLNDQKLHEKANNQMLKRPFLRTERALIVVHGEDLTLRVNDKAIMFKVGHTLRDSRNYYDESVNQINVIDVACEEYAQEVLGFLDSSTSGNPTPSYPIIASSSPRSLLLKEGCILYLEKLLNEDPSLNLPPIKNEDLKQADITMMKPSIEEPPELELKDLLLALKSQTRMSSILIDLQDQEKTTFTCPYRTFAYRRMPFGLCNAPGTFQRCMMAIFHDMIEKTIEVFMDDFSVFAGSFSSCLSHLDQMLKRCEDTNLVLNWEKCHFMIKEGIVLSHKISKFGIEVDRAKVDVIAKLPHPTFVKGVRSF